MKAILFLLAMPASAQFLQTSSFYPGSSQTFAPGSRMRLSPGGQNSCHPSPQEYRLTAYLLGSNTAFPVPLFPDQQCYLDAVIPMEIPPGPVELVLTGGREPIESATVHIVPSAITIDADYVGLLKESKLLQPATPGSVIVLRTTGAGVLPSLAVRLGDVDVPVTDLSRSPEMEGVDEIEFVIPPGVQLAGCYIPLRVLNGDAASPIVMLSVMPENKPCVHPLGLTNEQMQVLDRGGNILIGSLSMVSGTSGDSAAMAVQQQDRSLVAARAGPQVAPAFGCSLDPPLQRRLIYDPLASNTIGVRQLQLTGPSGQVIPLPQPSPPAFDSEPKSWIVPGYWTLSGAATNTIDAIQWEFRIPPPLQPDIRMATGPAKAVEWEWRTEGYTAGDVISGYVWSPGGSLYCLADATVGKFRFEFPAGLDASPLSFRTTLTRHASAPILRPLRLRNGESGVGLVHYSMPVIFR
ncbi:MAG: hypothetical protein HY820_22810 [Acidobacteria bacterium]|nr:hypothetical protein [Acidobacteriota bacterium]